MRIAETSLAAFHSFDPDALQAKEQRVIAAFKGNYDMRLTRGRLSELTGMPINCICGRVRALLDKGWLVVDGETVYSGTNKRHELLALAGAEQ